MGMVVTHYGDWLAHGTHEQMCGYQSVLPSITSLSVSQLKLAGPFHQLLGAMWELVVDADTFPFLSGQILRSGL